jgi:hypothetical protein
MPHLPPAHHETSKRDSLKETKRKQKQNKTIPDLNSNLAKSMTHHNQTKEMITWFLKILYNSQPIQGNFVSQTLLLAASIPRPPSPYRGPPRFLQVKPRDLEMVLP